MKPSSGLVGRAADRAALERRFEEDDARLVTLLGPPGIGKTALAKAFAAEHEGILVALDGVEDEAAFEDRIAAADLPERLLVLDGVKRAFAPLVERLLERAPEIAILATARERLEIEGEIAQEVGPLDVANGDAVEVLVAAARRAVHAYVPRPEDLPNLVKVARALEGVPLALELAGARLPIVGAALLAAAPAPAAGIVEATIAELDPEARANLARLSAFKSGFDVTNASHVLGRDAAATAAIIERLRALSLVRIRDASAGRFDLYRPVRVAAERAAPSVAHEARTRHADFFVREGEAAAARAPHDPAARRWLIAERDELMSIIEAVTATSRPQASDADRALRATVALSSVLFARGPTGAVAAIVSPLVERTRDSGADPRLSARVTALRGAIRRERGDTRSALKDLLAADSIARALGDELLSADVLVELGRTMLAAGEIAAARDHFDRAARAYATLGARAAEAQATALLGASIGALGDSSAARAMIERAAALVARDRIARAPVLVLLARACAETRDPAAAEGALAEAIGIAKSEEDVRVHGEALVLRGLLLLEAGDLDGVTATLAAARDLFSANGLSTDAAVARGWLGVAARARSRSAEAYALLADARDVCRRNARPAHAVAFGAFLALLDEDIGRADAARSALDALDGEANAAWEHAAAWPLPAKAIVQAARAGASASATAGATDGALHVRLLRSSNATAAEKAPPPSDGALLVGERGEWFRPPHGSRVGLERRRSLALLLDRLASTPGASLDAAALFAAAWPGERAIASAAAHRVRVGIATLRKLGLRDLVVTTPTGYALSADCQLVRV